MRIAFFAAEPSADRLVAEVAREILKKMPDAELCGVGGEALESLGVRSIFDIREFSTIGASELLANLPLLVRRLRQAITELRKMQPDVFISVDMSLASCIVARGLSARGLNASGLNANGLNASGWRIARKQDAKKLPIKLPIKIHYIAPSVWLSRPWRAKSFANCYDLILTLYPFEPRYFQIAASKIKAKSKNKASKNKAMQNKLSAAPARAVHVGHPIFDDPSPRGDGAKFRRDNLYKKNEPIVGLFFGSRAKEVRRFAPLLLDSARKLCQLRREKQLPEPQFIATSLKSLLPLLKPMLRENDPPVQLILEPEEKDNAICACNVALAACGTIGAELAIRHVPHALFYSVSSVSYLLSKIFYNLRYFGLVNLLEDRLVVKEFIQARARADLLAVQAELLLGADGADQTKELARMFPHEKNNARGAAARRPSVRAAEEIIATYETLRRKSG